MRWIGKRWGSLFRVYIVLDTIADKNLIFHMFKKS